ncbi:malonate decarboxylase holo-ACP synthase [Planotetraspora kaengkrachanensis]|uniref:Phosphoribosyl-dephospho-CoA transferase n=1 Tax=Planotetraspora kaengkrachanensis TaxID=575193 RepID=A0A8J3M573_9ACTN|nr:malonate decarboxylase holo-ACP synthase [Planotetraspora kaengkrachanensis]GIG79401.1 phosphoribosyl-dephospho-CoA transferase [Planotetraspora kaengkrachanensis]
MAVTVLPHDLLRLTGAAALDAALPAWARAALAACPWVVVRRAPRPPGLIPIGVRGPARGQRHAALVAAGAVTLRVPPEELSPRRPGLPRLAATLCAVARVLAGEPGLGEEPGAVASWGPIGGVGFELASGHRATHSGSDLDLLLRAPRRLEPTEAAELVTAFSALPCAVDCQVETPCGGISLVEWARTGGPVMARTAGGPHLVDDPWHRG